MPSGRQFPREGSHAPECSRAYDPPLFGPVRLDASSKTESDLHIAALHIAALLEKGKPTEAHRCLRAICLLCIWSRSGCTYQRYQPNTESDSPRSFGAAGESASLSRRPIAFLNLGSGLLHANPRQTAHRDAPAPLAQVVAIVPIGQVAERNAGLRIGPSDLSAETRMAEGLA
jgi:hypothetical protein